MAKEKTNDLIAHLMFTHNAEDIAPITLQLLKTIQEEDVDIQILSVASLLLNLLDKYEFHYLDALGMADHLVYSGANGNMKEEFKIQQKLMEGIINGKQ